MPRGTRLRSLRDGPPLDPLVRAEVEHDVALAEIGAPEDARARPRVVGAAEDDVGELLVLEAALGALREAMVRLRASRVAKWHQSPSGSGQGMSWGQGASVVPPAA